MWKSLLRKGKIWTKSKKNYDVNNKLMGEPITKPKTFSIYTESRIEHKNDKGMVMTGTCWRTGCEHAGRMGTV